MLTYLHLNVPGCSLCHTQHILKTWKSIYAFCYSVANRHAAVTKWRPWNSLVKYGTIWQIVDCIVSYISSTFCENPFTRFSIILPTKRIQRKIILASRGNCSISKMFHIVPCITSNLCWKFNENPFILSPVIVLTDTDFLESIDKENLYPFKMFPVSCPSYPKIAWNSIHLFSRYSVNRLNKHIGKPTQTKASPSPFERGNNKHDWK